MTNVISYRNGTKQTTKYFPFLSKTPETKIKLVVSALDFNSGVKSSAEIYLSRCIVTDGVNYWK